MRRRRPLPPFSVKRMLRDPNGLLTRLELAFALEPVHRIRPMGQLRGQRRPTPRPREED